MIRLVMNGRDGQNCKLWIGDMNIVSELCLSRISFDATPDGNGDIIPKLILEIQEFEVDISVEDDGCAIFRPRPVVCSGRSYEERCREAFSAMEKKFVEAIPGEKEETPRSDGN